MSPHTAAASQAPFRKNEKKKKTKSGRGFGEIIVILDISA